MEKDRKCAFVTGGSHGIGEGIVRVLAKNGYDVAFTYNKRSEEAKRVAEHVRAQKVRCFYYQASLEKSNVPAAVTRRAIRDLGGLDLLVCNAGVSPRDLVTILEAERMDMVYRLNFRSYLLCTGEAVRYMRENQVKGSVVFITSIRSDSVHPDDSIYGSIKAGLNRACKSLALELAPYGIRCNAIAPGATALEGDFDDPDMPMTRKWGFAPKIPLKRMAHPYEIGYAVNFLASEQASYITGNILKIDGGLSLPAMPEVSDDRIDWTLDLGDIERRILEDREKEAREKEAAAKTQKSKGEK